MLSQRTACCSYALAWINASDTYGTGAGRKALAKLRDLHSDKPDALLSTYPADFSETTS